MSDHFSVAEASSSGGNSEAGTWAKVGDLVDVDHIRDSVMVANIDSTKIAQTEHLVGTQGCIRNTPGFFRMQRSRAMGRDILIMVRVRIPLGFVGEDAVQRIPDAGIILFGDGQSMHMMIAPDRNSKFPARDKLLHKRRLLVMLDNMLYALQQLSMVPHHRMQIDAITPIVGKRFDNCRKAITVRPLRPGKNLITGRRQMGGSQFLFHPAFVDAGFNHVGA